MRTDKPFREDVTYAITPEVSFMASDSSPREFARDETLQTEPFLTYFPFCSDFGPLNLSCILRFCSALSEKIREKNHILVQSPPEIESRTNTLFLIGCFLILERDTDPSASDLPFSRAHPSFLRTYPDASYQNVGFEISVFDAWRALEKANEEGWLKPEALDLEEYDHYDDPNNGDMQIIVPNKLLLLKGPVDDMPEGSLWVDNHYVRMFHPKFYLEVFEEIGVKTVVRLNAPYYDPKFFQVLLEEEERRRGELEKGRRGGRKSRKGKEGSGGAGGGAHSHQDADIDHVDLFCEDCSVPPTQVIFHFLQLLQRVDGMVAVHCDTGLGVAAMLVATYLISFHSFTAREAISWVRIMRPGSIIGMQQLYLEEKEKVWKDAGRRMQTRCAPDVSGIADLRIRKDDTWRRFTLAEAELPGSQVSNNKGGKLESNFDFD